MLPRGAFRPVRRNAFATEAPPWTPLGKLRVLPLTL